MTPTGKTFPWTSRTTAPRRPVPCTRRVSVPGITVSPTGVIPTEATGDRSAEAALRLTAKELTSIGPWQSLPESEPDRLSYPFATAEPLAVPAHGKGSARLKVKTEVLIVPLTV